MYWSKITAILFVITFGLKQTVNAKEFSLFKCEKFKGEGNAADLNWNSYDYSGFQWISCIVDAEDIQIEAVRLNHGNCAVLDHWFLGRRFVQGDRLDITYSCLSPVEIEIDANGRTSKGLLK